MTEFSASVTELALQIVQITLEKNLQTKQLEEANEILKLLETANKKANTDQEESIKLIGNMRILLDEQTQKLSTTLLEIKKRDQIIDDQKKELDTLKTINKQMKLNKLQKMIKNMKTSSNGDHQYYDETEVINLRNQLESTKRNLNISQKALIMRQTENYNFQIQIQTLESEKLDLQNRILEMETDKHNSICGQLKESEIVVKDLTSGQQHQQNHWTLENWNNLDTVQSEIELGQQSSILSTTVETDSMKWSNFENKIKELKEQNTKLTIEVYNLNDLRQKDRSEYENALNDTGNEFLKRWAIVKNSLDEQHFTEKCNLETNYKNLQGLYNEVLERLDTIQTNL